MDMKIPFLFKMTKNLINFPTPKNISFMWNFGSLLGFMLMSQILTGIFLAMSYCPNIELAFESVIHICRDTNYGWMLRTLHLNGATFYFSFLYLHIGRGLYFESYKLNLVWILGIMILFISMAAAFLGYVLPWGQMSFWGATVITKLLTTIPYLGNFIVEWLWGGFSVDNPTLNRFFVLHFILPFIILLMVMLHILFLHKTGSSNPLGTGENLDKISFHPYFTFKDLITVMMTIFFIIYIITFYPYSFGDPDNFNPANSFVTPVHIKPEWYFLFAYSILRAIPSKFGGVLGLLTSILIFLLIPNLTKNNLFKGQQFNFLNKMYFWVFTNIFILLTWTGGKPVEDPFTEISQVMSIFYFLYFFISPKITKLNNFNKGS